MDADLKHLVRAIEQAFDVCFLPGQLPDDPTPGDIHQALQSHFKTKTLGVSLAAIAFWRLRAVMVRQ
ncbi:MAG TPA: hypothetical protein VFQ91_29020 [Bryobacteraceae bacterium]|nr:hypothetical protein [Bryobacteraceae bacterium]